MEKQTLFDLTSMPKMILITVAIVLFGTWLGAVGYLMSVSKIDSLVISLVSKDKALDPRCGEKVKFSGNCEIARLGFEFDSNKGKCVRKTGSCNVETPFNTLEKCQEVCERNGDTVFPDEEELIKCNNNSDCVLVNSGCCGCSMGGRMICINKKYLENWNQKLKLDCKVERACPAVYLCDDNPTGCECVNNVCQGVKE